MARSAFPAPTSGSGYTHRFGERFSLDGKREASSQPQLGTNFRF